MNPPEAYQPTQPQPVPQTAVVMRPMPTIAHPPHRRLQLVLAASIGLVLGMCIGVAITHATAPAPLAAPALGHLTVASTPDGNVMIDGRFSGVAPLDHLDLDPGKHSIVIDAFGYQPYAGTMVIKAEDKLNLSVLLAPIGDAGGTSGKFTGTGTIVRVIVPPSALQPVAAPAPAADPKKTTPRPQAPVSTYTPPPRPHRDCDGEKSRCTDGCSRASTDCDFSCPGCSSCNTSTGWDECKRQCDSCRSTCSSNTKFCESSCSSQYDNCEATQR